MISVFDLRSLALRTAIEGGAVLVCSLVLRRSEFSPFFLADSDRLVRSAPSCPVKVTTLPTSSNLLHVSLETLEDESSSRSFQLLFATTADRRLNLVVPNPTYTLFKSKSHLHDSPILSYAVVGKGFLTTISTSMSGQVILYDHKEDRVIEERRDHKKYVVQVATCNEESESKPIWVATAGWDAKIFVYRYEITTDANSHRLGEPVGSLALPTNPETMTFIKPPDTQDPILLVTRRDSTSLHFYALPDSASPPPVALRLLRSQNLAPYSNTWIAFSPSAVAVCPTDSTLLAVATSAVPHMKLIIVRLLLPPIESPASNAPEASTQEAQTRAKLAIQEREESAIKIHVSTLAPQTAYSTPQVCWRPDGSGVWVNGDDGLLRGIEAKSGKIVATLKNGHEAGSKIRSVWAGLVNNDGIKEEWVVSGGFDKRLVIWRPDREDNATS